METGDVATGGTIKAGVGNAKGETKANSGATIQALMTFHALSGNHVVPPESRGADDVPPDYRCNGL